VLRNVEIDISKNTVKNISKRKITSVQALPLLSSPDVLEQAICEKRKISMRFFFSGQYTCKWDLSIEIYVQLGRHFF
jgi:hypothetical protein